MVRVPSLIAAVAVSASLVACGSDSDNNGAPTPTTTTTGLSITGQDAIRTGFFANYTATATLSNGTTQTVTPSWTSSNPGIASVDTAGRVNGNAHGSVNLSASYQGLTASKNVNVVQNYGGTWTGTYRMNKCDQAGVFSQVRWCQELGGVGATLPFSLGLSQSGNNRDVIDGILALGSIAGNVSGSVSGDGRLVIGGTYSVTDEGITFNITIGGWDTRASPGDSMTGGWAQSLTATGAPGNAYQENQIVAVNHTSQQVTTSAAPEHYNLSVSALFARLRGN
jgi:hypothetical protein